MITDPISDLIIQIKNASMVNKRTVNIRFSKMKTGILDLLKAEGFIESYEVTGDKLKVIEIKLLGNRFQVERVSKPGRRIYAKKNEIPKIMTGEGIVIVSTSKGLLSGESAKADGLGGEVLLKIWE